MTLTKKLNVTKLHISSEVQCRFATTEINSRVENVSEKAEEAEFVANLPEGAFITYFEMEIDGKVIVGDVKEKQEAKTVYDAAKSRGETAGHVAQVARETNTFNISVNIAPYNFARFKLIYQELLQRVRGAYKHQINVHPGQAVDDLQVNVTIKENNPISILHVPTFASKLSDKSNKELLLLNDASDVEIEKVSGMEMTVKWHPSSANQSKYLTNDVLDGQLIVLYDVDRKDDEVLVVDGHFIHFLAPKNLDIGSKNIVFALDISGSMDDGKLDQTKTAMRSILNQLRPTDQFSILCFNTALEVWKNKPVLATRENISEAIGFVDAQHPNGGTNIDLAVQEGIKWLKGDQSRMLASILVLLTDGGHNSGEFKSPDQITPRIMQARRNDGQNIKVYGLGFGNDADFNLLREMSTKTGGFARKIYAASDAAIQLDSFYAEISSPLLADLNIKYLNPNVEVVSAVKNTHSDTLFEGSEFVIIGKMNQLSLNEGDEIFEWHARGSHGPKIIKCCYRPSSLLVRGNKGEISKTAGSFIERSWAYLTVKNLLEKAKIDSEESANLKNQALQLALKYKFVTELTSMVVTQADNARELDQIDPPEGKSHLPQMPSGCLPVSFQSFDAFALGGANFYSSTSPQLSRQCQSASLISPPTSPKRASRCLPASLISPPPGLKRAPQRQQASSDTTPPVQQVISQYLPASSSPANVPAVMNEYQSCGRSLGDTFGSAIIVREEKEKNSETYTPDSNICETLVKGLRCDYEGIADEANCIPKRGLTETQKIETNKARVQLSTLVGLEEKKLEEMCEDQPPTIIEKLLNMPSDVAIAAIKNEINDDEITKVFDEFKSKDNKLLCLVAALVASKLSNSPPATDLLRTLLEVSSDEIRINQKAEGVYVVECDAGQLVTVTSLLSAVHWVVRLNHLCGIKPQNQLIQFVGVVVGSTKNGAMEEMAKQVTIALNA